MFGGLGHKRAARALEFRFDYEFCRLLSRALRDRVLDEKTTATVRSLPASAALVRKMRLKDTDALMDYLRVMVADPKTADAGNRVALNSTPTRVASMPRLAPRLSASSTNTGRVLSPPS